MVEALHFAQPLAPPPPKHTGSELKSSNMIKLTQYGGKKEMIGNHQGH
jgi:hypothetical protein